MKYKVRPRSGREGALGYKVRPRSGREGALGYKVRPHSGRQGELRSKRERPGAEGALGYWLLAGLTLLWSGMVCASGVVDINHAWIREAPPGAPMMAGYLCLDNTGDTTLILTGVESPAFTHIMMHRTETVDGIARMVHQNEVIIPAGKQVCFEPGGLHLMMPAPQQRLVAGNQVELILQFADAPLKHIQVPVKAP